LTHIGFFLLTLGAVFTFAQRYFNSSVAWLACAILVTVPSLLNVATSAYVDAMLAFYAFAAFYALMLALEKDGARWYALAGAFAGLAASVKYTALIVPVAIFVLILLRNRDRNLTFTVHFSLIAILFALPFYLRNLIFTGNPVYPFFFGGSYWDAFRADHFSRFGSGLIATPLKIFTAPWDATIFGVEGGVDYSATIGPLLLALLPLLLLQIRNSQSAIDNSEPRNAQPEIRFTLYALLFSLILYLFWLFGIAESKLLIQTRLFFPAFPTLALLAALALEQLGAFDLAQFSLARFARLLTALILGMTLLSYALAFVSNNPLAYVTGAQSRDQFLRGALGDYYTTAQFINTQLTRNSRTLALWEPRSYYVDRDIQPDVVLDSFPHVLSQMRDADGIVRAWHDLGYTHVLLYRKGLNQLVTTQYDPVSLDDVRVLQAILGQHARLIYGEPLEIAQNEIVHADAVPYAIYALEAR
jgi:4-amino-4-deoxy-L-arabinose transferase-like glycosyltransferase